MEFLSHNLFYFFTITPHLVPEVLQKASVRNPIAVSLGAIAGSLSRYYLDANQALYAALRQISLSIRANPNVEQ